MPNRPFWERNSQKASQTRIRKLAESIGADVKAVNILFNCHWDDDKQIRESYGWVSEKGRKLTKKDFEYAKEAGVMFDPVERDHDALIAWTVKMRDALDRSQVVAAFVSSLRTGRPDHRSILGSYACHLNLKKHKFADSKHPESTIPTCKKCNLRADPDPSDLGEVNFLRLFRGGRMESRSIDYAAGDMELFAMSDESVDVTKEDRKLFKDLLKRLRALPGDAELGELQKSLTGLFKGNKHDRQQVCEILGYCGVLQPKRIKPVWKEYFLVGDKEEPNKYYKKEWAYPVQLWTGEDGVNDDALAFWFSDYV